MSGDFVPLGESGPWETDVRRNDEDRIFDCKLSDG